MNERGGEQSYIEEQGEEQKLEVQRLEAERLGKEIMVKHKEKMEKLRQQKGKKYYVEEPVEIRRECNPEIEVLENLLIPFESKDFLHKFKDIAVEKDALNYNERGSANKIICPILVKLDIIDKKTNIIPEKYKELRVRYNKIANAVGMINSGIVYHDRAK